MPQPQGTFESLIEENRKILYKVCHACCADRDSREELAQDPLNKALMLLYLDEHSYREIADVLGISETNVATKINRLKKKIRVVRCLGWSPSLRFRAQCCRCG